MFFSTQIDAKKEQLADARRDLKSAKADAKVLKDAKTKKYVPDVTQSWGLGERGKGSQHQPEVLAFLGFLSDILEISGPMAFLLLPPLGGNVGIRCSCPEARPSS